jgi:hypothetical protein
MKISDTVGIFSAAMVADDTVLITGLHGIGKTEVVRAWAKANDVHLEVLYLSTQEVGDLIGIPEIITAENGTKITTWTVPSWLNNLNEASKNGHRTCVFLDELSRAPLDVRQASLQLVLDREIHQHELPVSNDGFRTLVIAGDNPDNGDYSVDSMDPALLDRFCSIEVEVDVMSWLDWARKNNVNKIVTAFIADNTTKLHWMPEDGSEDRVGATPRSWTKLGKFIDIIDTIKPSLHYPIMKGKVGTALASQFLSFMKNFKDMISIEDVEAEVIKLQKKTSNIEKLGDGISKLTEKLEAIQKSELNLSMIAKYIDKKDVKDTIPMMAMLYSLEIETLAGFLKSYKDTDKDNYSKIAQFDKELNQKGLFIKIVSRT